MSRVSPLPRPEWRPDLTDFLAGLRSAVADTSPQDDRRQPATHLLGTLARHPDLAVAFLTFNQHLLSTTTLGPRHRELLVLRAAAVGRSDYEWAQHAVLAEYIGIGAEDIARAWEGPDSPGWSPLEQALMRAVDELLGEGAIGDRTWEALASTFDDREMLDIIFTVGCYSMLGMMLRSCDVEPESSLSQHLPTQRT